jgi:hypothetical protein
MKCVIGFNWVMRIFEGPNGNGRKGSLFSIDVQQNKVVCSRCEDLRLCAAGVKI